MIGLLTCYAGGVAADNGPSAPGQVSDAEVAAREAKHLKNIRQLTFPAMGFTEAGEGYFAPDGKSIAFQAVPTGKRHYQIYTLDLKTNALRMVSTGRGETSCAYFRPDGQRLLFASSHEDPRLAAGEEELPHQGSDGGKRKYVWNRNPYLDIYETDLDGGHMRGLIRGHGYDAEGTYSQDGKLLAFSSDRTGSMEIYVADADGGNVRQLTHGYQCYNGGPFISPDGKRIVWRADRDKPDMLQIYVMNIDGSGEVQLTNDEDVVNWGPFWHPAGRSIIYATSLHGHWNYELYMLNLETGQRRRITFRPRFDGLPAFSPDGSKLMWTSKRSPDESSQLFIADFTLPEGF